MKRLILIALLAPLIAFAGPVVTPEPSFNDLGSLVQTMFTAKAGSFAVYPSYDPYIKVGGVNKPWGFGVAFLYPLSEYAFAGARLDFLGDSFWAPSAVVGAKYTLRNLLFTPTVFTVAGLIMPLQGGGEQNRVVGAITGVGMTAVLYHDKSEHFTINAFIQGEHWTNFEGAIIHPGVAASWKF